MDTALPWLSHDGSATKVPLTQPAPDGAATALETRPPLTAFQQRRRMLTTLSACGSLGTLGWPVLAGAEPPSGSRLLTLSEMIEPLVGRQAPRAGGMRLEMPGLADNGHLVPARVWVDSPMSEADHVSRIWLLSSRNPVTRMATFHLGPWSGRAEVSTRLRLAGTQLVVALAKVSTGEFRVVTTEVVVTESACLDMT